MYKPVDNSSVLNDAVSFIRVDNELFYESSAMKKKFLICRQRSYMYCKLLEVLVSEFSQYLFHAQLRTSSDTAVWH